MAKYRALCVICCLIVLGSAASYADSITGYFDLTCSSNHCAAYNAGGLPLGTISPLPAVGQVTFSLNGNGTIAATLDVYGSPLLAAPTVLGFGFDSAGYFYETGWTPATPDIADGTYGFFDRFGIQPEGFGSPAGHGVPLVESWTIGTTSEFTSVSQALNGSTSIVDFFLVDSNGQYGAILRPSVAATPEPGSFLLFGSGVLGLLGAFRRKLAR
jgi:hypothetical protein